MLHAVYLSGVHDGGLSLQPISRRLKRWQWRTAVHSCRWPIIMSFSRSEHAGGGAFFTTATTARGPCRGLLQWPCREPLWVAQHSQRGLCFGNTVANSKSANLEVDMYLTDTSKNLFLCWKHFLMFWLCFWSTYNTTLSFSIMTPVERLFSPGSQIWPI